MCRHSLAAVTPVKYECHSKNLTGTFARSNILLTEKLTKGALVTPTPDLYSTLPTVVLYVMSCHNTAETLYNMVDGFHEI